MDINRIQKLAGIINEAPIPPSLLGLAAEARKASNFEQFKHAYILQIKHGTYWHITSDPQFTIDPKRGPRDRSSMSDSDEEQAGKLMITSHLSHWLEEYPDRKYAALVDMSEVPSGAYYQVNRGFGNEFYVNDPSTAKVLGVYNRQQAREIDRRRHTKLPNSEEELLRFYKKVYKITYGIDYKPTVG